MIDNMVMFFNTNCFSEMPVSDLRYSLQYPCKKFITSTVYQEIVNGYSKNPDKEGFSLIIDATGKLKRNLNIIDLNKCEKHDNSTDIELIKSSPILCSAYYTWLPYAINPCIVTDPFRHTYNNFQAIVNKH